MSDNRKHPNVPDGYEELEGKCYYKSGWCQKKANGTFAKLMGKKEWYWVQLIHWVIYYYPEHQRWYNWGQADPPSEEDSKGIDLPSLPDMPELPGMPKIDMPKVDMPDMPKVDMPDAPKVDMPDAPKIDAPKLGGLKKMKKTPPEHGPHGRIYIHGGTVKKSGKTFTLKADHTMYFKEENEKKDNDTVAWTAKSDTQADSWYESLIYGGAKDE